MNRHITLMLVTLLVTTPVFAELVLSAPPRENPEESRKMYGPLAEELSKVVGETVIFEAPVSWAIYSKDMRDGKYDFVLDGPHFVAWRMAHLGHVPLVRADGMLNYSVFSREDGPSKLDELRFKDVCVMASPNLAAVVLLSQFESYSTPNIVAPKGGVKGSFEAFEQGHCLAVTLPSYFLERLPKERVAPLSKIFSSPDMPNLALTAGPRVAAKYRPQIVKALTATETQGRLKLLMQTIGGKGHGTLIPAKASDYAGFSKVWCGVGKRASGRPLRLGVKIFTRSRNPSYAQFVVAAGAALLL